MNKFILLFLASVAAGLTAAADAQTSTTNIVRFRLSYGTTFFGDVDVQLFDDKPLTVSNFLANVASGLYENSILHDLRPGFTLQGGVGKVSNPYSSAPFELISRVPTNAPVPNEFGVGSPRSNGFGTLAMAKNQNDTNSAPASWFFNLGNNGDGFGVTNLDAALGGFTAFGRVVKGSNVLAFFNTFAENDGIQNLTNSFHLGFCPPLYLLPDGVNIGFDALPVGFFGLDCVRYSDLFKVQVFVLGNTDTQAPKVVMSFPPANASVTGDVTPVTGTATDNEGVETVRVYLNTNGPVTASGTGVWSAVLNNVPPGTNVVTVEVTDAAGNLSQVTRAFFRSILIPVSVQQVGNGTVTGPANGALLELDRAYTLVAKPAPGFIFAGWTGTLNQSTLTLPFVMESNFNATAVFVSNPFPALKGTYNGLFYNTNQVEQQSSGFLTMALGDFGAYSARLYMNGRNYRFSGHFSATGGETNLIVRTGTNELLVRMALDLIGGSDHLTGSVTNNQILSIDTNASWGAGLMADRAIFNAKTNPALLAGNYTMAIPHDTNTTAGPGGDSFATLSVSSQGRVSFIGTLADGTKAVQRVPVSKTGALPLYVPLYRGAGALISWVNFDTNQATTDLTGLLNWFKQSQSTAKYYSGGFTNEVVAEGSRYIAPPLNTRVLNLTNAVIGFTNGNLAADFANNVTLGTDNRIQNNSANALSLTIQKANGLFNGSVTPPGGGSALPFKGALLQKQNRGAGHLLGTSQSSQVRLAPAP